MTDAVFTKLLEQSPVLALAAYWLYRELRPRGSKRDEERYQCDQAALAEIRAAQRVNNRMLVRLCQSADPPVEYERL